MMASSFQTSAWSLALLLSAAPVCAQPGGDAAAGAPKETAAAQAEEPGEVDSDLVANAIALRKKGDEAAAVELLREAYDTERTPRVAGHLGLAERALGLSRQAEEHLSEALAARDDEWVRANEELLADALRYARRQLAWVRVVLKPKGVSASVSIAGEQADASQRARVKAGSITVEVSAPGYRPQTIRAEIAPEKELLLNIDLVKLPTQPVASAAPSKPNQPGPRSLPDDTTSTQRTWAYVSGGVGVVGLGLATYFGLEALSKQQTAKDLCPETQCANQAGVDADQDARSAALFSDLSLGVGVVALGVSVYLLLSDDAPAQARSKVRLTAAPGRAVARWVF